MMLTSHAAKVVQTIAECAWSPVQYLFFSENVFDTLVYYAHLVPLLLTMGIGFFVWRYAERNATTKAFLVLALSFAVWTLSDLVLWAHNDPAVIMFFWTFQVVIEPIMYISAWYFCYTLFLNRLPSLWQHIIALTVFLPVIIWGPTHATLLGFDLTNCDREALEGPLVQYEYLAELFFVIAIIITAVGAALRAKVRRERIKIVLISFGTIAFLFLLALGNIVGTLSLDWSVAQYGLIGMPIFLGLIGFTIFRYKIFDIKLLATDLIVFALGVVLVSLLFLEDIQTMRLIVSLSFIPFALLAIFLVRSVKLVDTQRQNLEQANNEQQALIHFITHQVKGFFTKSKNVFSMLVEGEYGTVTPEAKAIIHEALASETKGVAMVQEILNAANLHRGTVSYTASAYNFLSLIRSQIQDIQPAADAKNIKVTITVEGNDSDFAGQADVTNISHVIKNILDNAVRYTPSGSIAVHVMHQYGSAGDPHFVCEITDTGVGLDAEDAQRLFTEGGRGHDSVRVNVESTGYGLYIAKKIVNAHGGTISATSAGRGKGSTFRIEVPAQVAFARI